MPATVTLFTRGDCEMCEIVERILCDVRRRRPFVLKFRDIDNDPADYDKYKHDIPVVTVNGHEVAKWKLTAAEFEAALDRWGGETDQPDAKAGHGTA